MFRGTLITALAMGVAACAVLDYRKPYYEGRASDHFDGVRFFNPDGPGGKGLFEVLKWQLVGDKAEWPEFVPVVATATPEARVEGDELRITFVGHATVLIQTAGLNILTDPTWSNRASPLSWAGPRRVTPPGIAFDDLPPIDAVVVTHNHYDHLDLPTLSRLGRTHDPVIIMPLGNDVILRRHDPALKVKTLDWWQPAYLRPDVKVHAVPVYHWSRRGLFDRNKALWSGFVIETPGGNVYVAGDTGFGDGQFFRKAVERFGGFRLSLLPVGAYEPRWFMKAQHVNPTEAVQVHKLLQAEKTIGVHLRTFQLSDESIHQPELDLQAALQEQDVSPRDFFVLSAGEVWSDRSGPAAAAFDAGSPEARVKRE